jgi:Protein of unknown function (DUF3050)
MNHTNIQVTERLSPLIEQIQQHPLYEAIHSVAHLRLFMEHHVFAVWDFMCLLKELHRRMVSTQAPWFPPKDAYCAHLINRILVEEEGDVTEDGVHYLSHFEIYLQAMQKMGANTQRIQTFLSLLAKGYSLAIAADMLQLPDSIQRFVQTTFSFFDQSTPELAAAFVYGREAITPLMFTPLIRRLAHTLPTGDQPCLETLSYYLQRHIELDHGDHFPQALHMLNRLAGEDMSHWRRIEIAAQRALQARLDFFTSIQHVIAS